MRLDSARESKRARIERLPELGVQGAPENPTGGWLALGIAPTGPGGHSLAVRMADPHSAGEAHPAGASEAADEIDGWAVGRIVADLDRGPAAALGLLFAGSATGGPDGTWLTYGNALATVLAEFGAQWAGGVAP